MADKTSIPRLHSARLKSGGATLRVLHNRKSNDVAGYLKYDADVISQKRKDDIVGFVVIAWTKNGSTSTSVHVENGRWCGLTEVPEMAKMVLQDYVANI